MYIHPDSQKLLDGILQAAPHALLIAGPVGIGLSTVAMSWTDTLNKQVSVVLPEKNEVVDLEKGSITVQSIRRLYDYTKTRQPSGRIVIIDYAERMAIPAQNAFLKLLEEPTQGTQFILLTHTPDTLLPTIQSRVQRIDLRPITVDQSLELLDTLAVTDATKRAQLMFIAEGLPAELTRLAANNEYFEQRAACVKDARLFVTGTQYERLLIAKKYKDDRGGALLLLSDAMRQLTLTLAHTGDEATLALLQRLEEIHRRIAEQGNIRLQLSAAGVASHSIMV